LVDRAKRSDGVLVGQSTTVKRLDQIANSGSAPKTACFWSLRGIAKEVFESSGGGESFLREERDRFNAKP
jgi:hypothetical protein